MKSSKLAESFTLWHETLQKVLGQFMSMMNLDQLASLCDREFERQRNDTDFIANIHNSAFFIRHKQLLLSADHLKRLFSDVHVIFSNGFDSDFDQNTCNYDTILKKRAADDEIRQFSHDQIKRHAIENQIEFVDMPSMMSGDNLQAPSRLMTKKLHRGILIKRDRVDNLEGPLAQTVFPFIKNKWTEASCIEGSDGLVVHRAQEANSQPGKNDSFYPPCDGLLYHPRRKETLVTLEERLHRMEEYLQLSKDSQEGIVSKPTTHPTIPCDIYTRIKRLETALLRIEMKYPSIALKEFHPNVQVSLYEE